MKYVLGEPCDPYGEGDTVLAALADARVVKLEKCDDGSVRLIEQCDRYFSAPLTKIQLLALVSELLAVATGMPAPERRST